MRQLIGLVLITLLLFGLSLPALANELALDIGDTIRLGEVRIEFRGFAGNNSNPEYIFASQDKLYPIRLGQSCVIQGYTITVVAGADHQQGLWKCKVRVN